MDQVFVPFLPAISCLCFRFSMYRPDSGDNVTASPSPGGKNTSDNLYQLAFHLEHDHDVDAVTSGEYAMFIFGKITYRDMLHLEHEFDFCRYYQVGQPTEPNKLRLCGTYNGEN